MKTLVVYYSYTGNTELVAQHLAKELKADLKKVESLKKRSKLGTYFFGSFAALGGKCWDIKPMDLDIKKYDRIFIGSPVWAGNPVPAINTFVKESDFSGKNVIVFVTLSGDSPQDALKKMSSRIEEKGGRIIDSFAIQSGGKTKQNMLQETNELLKKYK